MNRGIQIRGSSQGRKGDDLIVGARQSALFVHLVLVAAWQEWKP